MKQGSFIISLDYELMWGMFDVVSKDGYGKTNVQNVPVVLDKLIELFQKYDIHATIAAVGMLMYNNKQELIADLPSIRPTYNIPERSAYNGTIDGIQADEESLFFQLQSVEKMRTVPTIEIGTHTYCHYYCWESGQSVQQFEADITKACEVAERNGIKVRSIIFPRNQVSSEHLRVCAKHGITSYRGNALKYFDQPKSKCDIIKNRILRFLDSYINIGGMTSVPYDDITEEQGLVNLRASRLLRPYSKKLSFIDGFRLRRMKKEMVYAAQNCQMYHIWWHPHNFGVNMNENLAFLEELLKHYKYCEERFGMKSYTMNELYEELKKEH